jgi:hypothetical protein
MQPAPQQAPSGYGVGGGGPAGATSGDRERRNDLSSWWKTFKHRAVQKKEDDPRGATGAGAAGIPQIQTETEESQGIFGVPLQQSVRYANVAISLSDGNGQSYIYGYVPIVVAKCGVFLKEKGECLELKIVMLLTTKIATDVEGIFRLSGSEKRIKELRNAFNSPDRYGKGLDWTGYTVHDAANILRRYFNQLPEPIIPLEFYDKFRDPLRGHQSQAVGQRNEKKLEPSSNFDSDAVIKTYQHLITQLPPLNRQLLLYILDLLAVFASKSDLNKMTTANLAAIFQPGILRHPAHDMTVSEYHLSQDVLIFLIENQDHFLIGMQGTAADEQTVHEVESGPPTPANRTNTMVRSGSDSSRNSGAAGPGGVRRSASASSRKSRGSTGGVPSPVTPTAPGVVVPIVVGAAGVHRSNTLPPRSPNLSSSLARFGDGTASIRENDVAAPTKLTSATTVGTGKTDSTTTRSAGNVSTVVDTSHNPLNSKENVPTTDSRNPSSFPKGKPAAVVNTTTLQKKPHSQAVLHEVMSHNENLPSLPDATMGPPRISSNAVGASRGQNLHTQSTTLQTLPQVRDPPRQGPDSLSIPTSPNLNSNGYSAVGTSGQQVEQTLPGNKGPGAALAALFGGKSPQLATANDDMGGEGGLAAGVGGGTASGEVKKKPNKLQKRPKAVGPGGIMASANSSTGSLSEATVNLAAGGASIATSSPDGLLSTSITSGIGGEYLAPIPPMGSSIKLGGSPAMGSVSATSDVEDGGDVLGSSVEQHGKKGRWFRRHHEQPSNSTGGLAAAAVGSNGPAAVSRSSVLSSEGRKSTALERGVTSDSEQETYAAPGTSGAANNRRDPISWVKGKIREGRDKLRVASPSRETQNPHAGNIDEEIGGGEREGHEQQHNVLPGIVEPYVSGSGLAQMIRGRSFEAGRGKPHQDNLTVVRPLAGERQQVPNAGQDVGGPTLLSQATGVSPSFSAAKVEEKTEERL